MIRSLISGIGGRWNLDMGFVVWKHGTYLKQPFSFFFFNECFTLAFLEHAYNVTTGGFLGGQLRNHYRSIVTLSWIVGFFSSINFGRLTVVIRLFLICSRCLFDWSPSLTSFLLLHYSLVSIFDNLVLLFYRLIVSSFSLICCSLDQPFSAWLFVWSFFYTECLLTDCFVMNCFSVWSIILLLDLSRASFWRSLPTRFLYIVFISYNWSIVHLSIDCCLIKPFRNWLIGQLTLETNRTVFLHPPG